MFKYILVLALWGACVSSTPLQRSEISFFGNIPRGTGGRIINGEQAAPGAFPYQVALFSSTGGGTSFCGGSLINETWVLTAAHCVASATSARIYAGVTNLDDPIGRVEVAAARIIVHQNWTAALIRNDIALLELAEPVPLGENIQILELSNERAPDNVPVTVSGWGKTSDTSAVSRDLNYVNVTVISNARCAETYGSYIQESIICTIGTTIESTCNGDSGGPLVTGYYTSDEILSQGIVSFGSSQGCTKGFPTAYTRTAFFRDWIRQQTGI